MQYTFTVHKTTYSEVTVEANSWEEARVLANEALADVEWTGDMETYVDDCITPIICDGDNVIHREDNTEEYGIIRDKDIDKMRPLRPNDYIAIQWQTGDWTYHKPDSIKKAGDHEYILLSEQPAPTEA